MYKFYKKVAVCCCLIIFFELIWGIVSIVKYKINNLPIVLSTIASLIFLAILFSKLETDFKELSESLDECREKLNLPERIEKEELETIDEDELEKNLTFNEISEELYNENEWADKPKEFTKEEIDNLPTFMPWLNKDTTPPPRSYPHRRARGMTRRSNEKSGQICPLFFFYNKRTTIRRPFYCYSFYYLFGKYCRLLYELYHLL